MELKKPALREALAGNVGEHHRFVLRQLLAQLDHIDAQVEAFDLRIAEVMSPLERRTAQRLDEIPGFDVRTGQNVIAEIGTDMSRFPSAARTRPRGPRTVPGERPVGRQTQARQDPAGQPLAQGGDDPVRLGRASRTRDSYFAVRHRRLGKRRGVKRASVAVAHSLLGVAYELLKHPDLAYTDLGADHFDKRSGVERQVRQMLRRLKRMGCEVEIKRPAA
jgi:transposase